MKSKTICPECMQQEDLERVVHEMGEAEKKRLEKQITQAGEVVALLQERYNELTGQNFKYFRL